MKVNKATVSLSIEGQSEEYTKSNELNVHLMSGDTLVITSLFDCSGDGLSLSETKVADVTSMIRELDVLHKHMDIIVSAYKSIPKVLQKAFISREMRKLMKSKIKGG